MTTKEQLKAILKTEKEQLIARQKAKLAKFSKSAQKQQTRKKIILGAVVLKLVTANNKNFTEYLKTHLSHLSNSEKELFPEIFNGVVETETVNS